MLCCPQYCFKRWQILIPQVFVLYSVNITKYKTNTKWWSFLLIYVIYFVTYDLNLKNNFCLFAFLWFYVSNAIICKSHMYKKCFQECNSSLMNQKLMIDWCTIEFLFLRCTPINHTQLWWLLLGGTFVGIKQKVPIYLIHLQIQKVPIKCQLKAILLYCNLSLSLL